MQDQREQVSEIPENPFLTFRRRAGVSRQEMARATNITVPTLECFEKGLSKSISKRVQIFLELAGEDVGAFQRRYAEYYLANSCRSRERILTILRTGD